MLAANFSFNQFDCNIGDLNTNLELIIMNRSLNFQAFKSNIDRIL